MSKWENNEEIQIFREYLRIPSVHPDIDYTPCVEFLKTQANNLGLIVEVCHPGGPKKPVVILTWLGQKPELPSIMLNSHMDVVPVYAENWTHPPFGAEIDEQGRIFARGSQDMKSVAMQYLGAIRALKKKGVTLKRSIHVTFVPDEEIANEYGMKAFVKSDNFKKLNVGFCLDEGYASNFDVYQIFYAEKVIWNVEFVIHGTSGHGSLLLQNTVGHKFQYILNKLMELREQAEKAIGGNNFSRLGEVNTINLTKVKGGVQNNVIPLEIRAVFDMRLAINADFEGLEKQLQKWCEEAGGDIQINFLVKEQKTPPTAIDDTNPFWVGIRKTMEKLGLKYEATVLCGITDNRYIRQAGIPALGFSPMANTTLRAHDNDEWLSAETYLKGIELYQHLITAIANV